MGEKVMTIEEIMPLVEALAAEASEVVALCWLRNEDTGEGWHANYCPACIKKLISWFGGGEKPFDDDDECAGEHPDWGGADVRFYCEFGYEAEGCRHCVLCGAHLSVTLLFYGVKFEIEHFEEHGISTPSEWRCIQDVLEGIEHVESGWFPGDWMSPGEVDRQRDLCARVIALVKEEAGLDG